MKVSINRNLPGFIPHIIVICILAGFMIYFTNTNFGGINMFFGGSGSLSQIQSENFSTSGTKQITVKVSTSAAVNVYESTDNENIGIIFSSSENDVKTTLECRESGSNLNITLKRNIVPGISIHKEILDIYLPVSYTENIDIGSVSGSILIDTDRTWNEAHFHTVSGSINTKAIRGGGNVKLSSTSGSISCEDTDVSNIELHSVSGKIEAGNLLADKEVNLNSTSGSIKAESLISGFSVGSVSGSIDISGISGNGSIKSTSGSITASFIDITGNLDMSTVSGSINMILHEQIPLDIEFNSVSGRLHYGEINAKGKLQTSIGSGGHKCKLHTTSGSVTIR